jgi:hypothetical protein
MRHLRLPAFRFLFLSHDLFRKPEVHFSGSCEPEASRKEVFRRRNGFDRSLRFASSLGSLSSAKTRARKNAPRERMVMTQQTAAEVDAETAALRRHYCNTFNSGAAARYAVAGPADLTACDGLTKLSTAP